MPKLKCTIVADESFAIELLSEKLKLFPDLHLVKTFTDPTVALLEIKMEDKIDILFLDIDMPGLTGLELGAKLRHKVKYLIFTTAFSKYAVEAFRMRVQDYLLKPIDKIRFIESMNTILSIEQSKLQLPDRELFFIKSNIKGKFVSVPLGEIILIYVEGHKLFIITSGQQYETSESLKNIESKLLKDTRFLRVHNSNMINLKKIVKIEGNTIEMEGKYTVPISETYKSKLMNVIGVG